MSRWNAIGILGTIGAIMMTSLAATPSASSRSATTPATAAVTVTFAELVSAPLERKYPTETVSGTIILDEIRQHDGDADNVTIGGTVVWRTENGKPVVSATNNGKPVRCHVECRLSAATAKNLKSGQQYIISGKLSSRAQSTGNGVTVASWSVSLSHPSIIAK